MKASITRRRETGPLTRSETMARVRSRDTTPELTVRRILTDLGYRYLLHRADLPGTPDVAFIGRRKAVFVHGCFWHGHDCARGNRAPKTNPEYWRAMIARNRARDLDAATALDRLGWSVMTVWECELREATAVSARLARWLR